MGGGFVCEVILSLLFSTNHCSSFCVCESNIQHFIWFTQFKNLFTEICFAFLHHCMSVFLMYFVEGVTEWVLFIYLFILYKVRLQYWPSQEEGAA